MYICIMEYSKDDILICSTNNLRGVEQNLIVGDKYKVLEVALVMDENTILDLIHIDTNCRVGFFHDRFFIKIDVYREFQLRKILE